LTTLACSAAPYRLARLRRKGGEEKGKGEGWKAGGKGGKRREVKEREGKVGRYSFPSFQIF